MAAENTKAKAWALYDRIVADAAPKGVHTNPWVKDADGARRYEPDYGTLCTLLGVPLSLKANTQSGVPALALDVWISYELRRAGFGVDQTWPRPTHPRILPAAVVSLLKALKKDAAPIWELLRKKSAVKGVSSAAAKILGKNYLKQVDVIITDWSTGPELLISTKRMDSSFGKNAANRVEESYGDAKNLRLRHPQAALGFLFGLSAGALVKERDTAEWLFDLLIKLGQEDDAYHATCLVLMEYSGAEVIEDGDADDEGIPEEPGVDADGGDVPAADGDIEQTIAGMPKVSIRRDATPPELDPGRFLAAMVNRVLNTTPITMHRDARERRNQAKQL
ncbi:hypothetical protein [Paracidovorax avenae]|uniref:hypothetical protein n=1 Tax=Paracidovorax avenae TaxID=80867 RepID=UPI001AD807CF|nr:hypothetical protein [Paracidovorax avenae]